jgi:L-ascorbate metabolism protein UlaG (beta-lactamase superfamily)
MDPKQAAVAAKLLGAQTVVPIHYGRLHEASNYVQSDDPPGSLSAAAAELGIEARLLRPGEQFSVRTQQEAMGQ